jgi:hypothetical protein
MRSRPSGARHASPVPAPQLRRPDYRLAEGFVPPGNVYHFLEARVEQNIVWNGSASAARSAPAEQRPRGVLHAPVGVHERFMGARMGIVRALKPNMLPPRWCHSRDQR